MSRIVSIWGLPVEFWEKGPLPFCDTLPLFSATAMKKVLIIEDDKSLADLVELHLKDISCEVQKADKAHIGQDLALENDYDLIILDLMLPDGDGMDICRTLRMEKNRTPILMLTAKSEEIDKVLGLESGADDYLTKPFSVRELVARVKAIWRRMEMDHGPETEEQPTTLAYGDLEIDLDKRMVSLSGKRIDLTPKEFDLLSLLAQNPGRSYSRMRLLNLIWGTQFEGYEHTVNSHINRLRSKIEPDVSNPTFILTSWGYGYRFNDQIEES